MKHRWQLIALPVVALLILSAGASQAQEPVAGAGAEPLGGPPFTDMFTYQGYLTDAGAPANGRYDFDVTIWTAETGGTQVGNCTTAALSNVLVQNGVFTFNLYPDTDINTVFNGVGRWLQVKVRRHGTTTWTTLPRQPITTVPYAFGLRPGAKLEAQYAGTLFSLKNTYTAGSTAGSAITAQSAAPTVPTIAGQHNGDGPAIYGYTAGAYPAVEGMHGSNGAAVGGYNTGAGTGVYGSTSANAWPGQAGVWGRSTGRSPGVHGDNAASTSGGPGVYGTSTLGAGGDFRGGLAGIYAKSNSTGTGYAGGFYNNTDTANSQNYATVWMVNEGNGDLIWAAGGGSEVDFRVTAGGTVYADGSYQTPAADFAELWPAEAGLEPGDVLVIAADGRLARATEAFAANVAGVYSTRPGFVGGATADLDTKGNVPLAVVGIVPVKVSAENGPIRPGDLLTSARTSGHAMAAGRQPLAGTVIGKALEPLASGTGVIKMLVMLR